MKELLETYSDEGEKIEDIDKSEAHNRMRKEYFETDRVSIRHKHVLLMLMNSSGRVILQRRSKWKGDNAGMWDKTVGGHVSKDDGFDLTILKECAEELGIPSTVVPKDKFNHTVSITDLHVLGVITKLAFLDNHKSLRMGKNGKKWVHPSMTQFYVGYYDGSIKFIDKESCGIQVFSKEDLEQEMEDNPDGFTDDIKYILKKYSIFIKPVEKRIENVLND